MTGRLLFLLAVEGSDYCRLKDPIPGKLLHMQSKKKGGHSYPRFSPSAHALLVIPHFPAEKKRPSFRLCLAGCQSL